MPSSQVLCHFVKQRSGSGQLAKYKPTINSTLLIPELKQAEETTKSTLHIVLYEQKCKESKEKQKSREKFLREYCKTEIMILDFLRFRYSSNIVHT